jgi:hypothetical protein
LDSSTPSQHYHNKHHKKIQLEPEFEKLQDSDLNVQLLSLNLQKIGGYWPIYMILSLNLKNFRILAYIYDIILEFEKLQDIGLNI